MDGKKKETGMEPVPTSRGRKMSDMLATAKAEHIREWMVPP